MSLAAIFLASLLGSMHCAAMCGGFVTFCAAYRTSGPAGLKSSSFIAQALYHFGRLLAYLTLGILAGFFGSRLNEAGALFGLETLAAWILGVLLIVWGGVRMFPQAFASTSLRFQSLSRFWSRLSRRSIALLPASPSAGLVVGLLSGLIPCGWLWGFVALAAASGSPTGGALATGVFWLGTLPALAGVGWGAQFFLRAGHRILPRLTAILIILSGILTILGHVWAPRSGHADPLLCGALPDLSAIVERRIND